MMSGGRHVHYSIVIPVYGNEGCLLPLYRALSSEIQAVSPNLNGEIVFVDDGSEDGSFSELMQIRNQSPAGVTVVKLTRNFGQNSAILAGYAHARGDCVLNLAADGQEPPELVSQMLRAHFDEHYEVVICPRTGRDESLYRSLTSRLYFFLLRRLTSPNIPAGGFDIWLLGRRALAAFLRNSDANTSLQWRVLWLGFATKAIPYRRRARLAGRSRYTFTKKLSALLDGVLGESLAPVRLIWSSGCLLSLLGAAGASYLLADRLGRGSAGAAWGPLAALLLVVGGMLMTALGIVGEYVWRALVLARRRDTYLVEAVHPAAER